MARVKPSARCVFQSTPPARGATVNRTNAIVNANISIHAPREGGDGSRWLEIDGHSWISIHAPREGGDSGQHLRRTVRRDFNPRPPRGGRRWCRGSGVPAGYRYFNPRPPRGGRRPTTKAPDVSIYISIHAPREGGDETQCDVRRIPAHFNPRPPRGGRRRQRTQRQPVYHFNPRPPRGGRRSNHQRPDDRGHFNPRPPRGGRLHFGYVLDVEQNFNPRPPRGGRRGIPVCHTGLQVISIHAPREGGDRCRRRGSGWRHRRFQSTPPARGATVRPGTVHVRDNDFNPRPPRGGRQRRDAAGPNVVHFNPRPPRGGRR